MRKLHEENRNIKEVLAAPVLACWCQNLTRLRDVQDCNQRLSRMAIEAAETQQVTNIIIVLGWPIIVLVLTGRCDRPVYTGAAIGEGTASRDQRASSHGKALDQQLLCRAVLIFLLEHHAGGASSLNVAFIIHARGMICPLSLPVIFTVIALVCDCCRHRSQVSRLQNVCAQLRKACSLLFRGYDNTPFAFGLLAATHMEMDCFILPVP